MGQVLSVFGWFLCVAFEILNNVVSVQKEQPNSALTGRGGPPENDEPLDASASLSSSSRNDLHGAVDDADAFEEYLLTIRNVPKANITNLRNEGAKRSDIIKGFEGLRDNSRIIPGEAAIVIYFAGHGAVAPKPDAWTDWVIPTNKVEMLCPADLNQDIHGKGRVEGIPDRTLSQLLLDLSKAKGNNITLILDCCHAAGQTRGVGMRSRALDLQNLTLSPTCDEDIYSRGSQSRSFEKDQPGFSDSYGSHVLLAACKRTETAWEKDKGGIFTAALLSSLKSDFARKNPPPSYDSLMRNLKMVPEDVNQHAHWDGRYIRRRLFDSWQEPVSGSMIPCHKGDGNDWPFGLILHVGSLHGITEKSNFEIFKSDSPNLEDLITTLTVKAVKTVAFSVFDLAQDSTTFTSDGERPSLYARLRKASGPYLHICCDDTRVLDEIFADDDNSRLTASVCRVTDLDKADLCLTVDEGAVLLHRGKTFREFFPRSSPLLKFERGYQFADIRDFINRYSHFTSHLTKKSPIPITDLVTVKMVKYRRRGEKVKEVALPAIDDDGRTEIVIDTSLDSKRDLYGFTICPAPNLEPKTNLYVYLLYFDASTSVIEIWYSSQMSEFGDSGDSCLVKSPQSELTLGHGNRLMRPLSFGIPAGELEDVCFIKIYVAEKAVDIRSLEQLHFSRPDTKARNATQGSLPVEHCDFQWASETIAIVTKKR
ncbi:hypothetical protein EDD18DRAFT_502339 [Armillaria luteobubalina]|uniref:Peptidase C14 caspase domain-containing protein n=1 Tax=Armillaria luteobubalina TaxID=153913 RepID=A0AA39QM99_9AGAR|nr:hypothetical protein EDD18DRAFT_502339 [Armillaria luteobubalina]